MSSDFFRVKKGLNIKPTDPAELSELEAGDLIVDSTDDNRLKVYDPTTSDFASVGTGGSSGNIMSDIEKLTPVVSNVVAVTDTVTFLPIDDNNKSVKATFSGSDGTIRYEAPASADLDGVQGVVKVWIKTSLNNLSVVATKDGVAQNNGVTINSTNKWRQYEIPVVLGDADYGFEIQASGAVAGDVFIDEGVVKVERVVKELGQAQFVGSVEWNEGLTNCQWLRTSGVMGDFTSDADCQSGSRIVIGNITDSSSGALPEITIPNARTDVRYEVKASGSFYKSGANYICYYAIDYQDGVTSSGNVYDAADSVMSPYFSENFRFATSGNKLVKFQAKSNDGSTCIIDGRFSGLKISVFAYPDANSTIVAQDTELTAKTANEFSARVDGAGGIQSTNYNWLSSCTQPSAGNIICNFESGVFNEAPSCRVTNNAGADATSVINSLTNSSVNFRTFLSGVLSSQSINFECSKQGTDVNKSATIVGKFENINSSDLVKVRAKDLVGATSTTSFSYNYVNTITVLEDNYNALNDTGDIVFTAPKDSYYDFDFGARLDGATLNQIECGLTIVSSVTGASNPAITNDTNNAVASVVYPKCFFSNIKLAEGDTVTFYVRKSGTAAFTWNTDQRFSYLKITELPDTESIIKNLSQQKTLCQTKDLSADVTSDGTISSLSFSNLEIGKKYEIKIQARTSNNATVTDNVDIYADHDGSQILVLVQHHANAGGTSVTRNEISRYFTATSTTLTVGAASVGANMTITASGTNTRLCELPDTYVETTKFD